MAFTYSKIASYTVGSGGIGSVAFLNIPQTYTDLVIKTSSRTDGTGNLTDTSVRFNFSDTGYSGRLLFTIGTSVSTQSESTSAVVYRANRASGTTANTFDNTEIYIPNYTSGNLKAVLAENAVENNGTSANLVALGSNLWSNTSPITSITFTLGQTFLQHSTFHLYGIKAEI